MTLDAAHSHFWETSDLQLVIYLIIGSALNWVWPLSLADIFPIFWLRAVGLALIAVGVYVFVATKIMMKRFNQPDGPWKPTTEIIDRGPFAYSRNPIYLGLATIMLGLAFSFNMPWWLILWMPYICTLHQAQVKPEERYLSTKFGDEYEAYCSRVRRWL